MPDAHVGYGLPIGGVLALEGAVCPYAVGVDIACRMKLSVFDVPPAEHMLVVKNDDRPGVIGTVGTLLGVAAINIADMDVGRAAVPGTATMLIATTAQVPDDVLFELRRSPGIISAVRLAG